MVDQLCVYQGRHYEQKDFDTQYAYQLIQQIPDDASVCAARMFAPHLALRKEIYDFHSVAPQVRADYMLILDSYFDIDQRGKILFYYRNEYETVATDGTIYLLRRTQP